MAAHFTEKGWNEIDTLVADALKNLQIALRKIESVLGRTAGTMFAQPPPSKDEEALHHFEVYADLWDANHRLWSGRAKIQSLISN